MFNSERVSFLGDARTKFETWQQDNKPAATAQFIGLAIYGWILRKECILQPTRNQWLTIGMRSGVRSILLVDS